MSLAGVYIILKDILNIERGKKHRRSRKLFANLCCQRSWYAEGDDSSLFDIFKRIMNLEFYLLECVAISSPLSKLKLSIIQIRNVMVSSGIFQVLVSLSNSFPSICRRIMSLYAYGITLLRFYSFCETKNNTVPFPQGVTMYSPSYALERVIIIFIY